MVANNTSVMNYSDLPFAGLTFWLSVPRAQELAHRLQACATAARMSFRKDDLPVFGGYAGVLMFGESTMATGGFVEEKNDRFYFDLGFYALKQAGAPERQDVVERFDACIRDLPGVTDLKRHGPTR